MENSRGLNFSAYCNIFFFKLQLIMGDKMGKIIFETLKNKSKSDIIKVLVEILQIAEKEGVEIYEKDDDSI